MAEQENLGRDALSPKNILPIGFAGLGAVTLDVLLEPSSGSPIANQQAYQLLQNIFYYTPAAVVVLVAAVAGTLIYLSRQPAVAHK
ncbi:MAG: hypothetical protein HY438_01460 [DPANN group archaeon]|nr:hypothetical protein [DPANN group archaeon]